MAKKNKTKKKPGAQVPLPTGRKDKQDEKKKEQPPTHPSHNAIRETFESLAIAFILAFLIRTFVAEPFVIPTGSMSPSLQGVHKDLNCPQCGQRYRVNASVQSQIRGQAPPDECVGGMCPMCRYTMAYDTRLARVAPDGPKLARNEPSYSGDRIVVNKFLYSFQEPERWDVVVFKYPGNATDNYIKRLVGLPEETLRVLGGDLFVQHQGEDGFDIARKPPTVARAMREPVHDTNHDPANLREAGWPLRWQADGWKVDETTEDKLVRQNYHTSGQGEHWLRYEHTPPDEAVWSTIEQGGDYLPQAKRELISDFNPYNTRISRREVEVRLHNGEENPFVEPYQLLGLHWVGDLHVEADVDVQSETGELLLELVEAGNRFRCTIDLATGKATLSILPYDQEQPVAEYAPTAETVLDGPGKHRVTFANVDDTLHLWVDDRLVKFDVPTTYDWQALFGDFEQAVPRSSEDELGDLAPARVGSVDAALAIDRLRVFRDIYYIADNGKQQTRQSPYVRDYALIPPRDFLSNKAEWGVFARRRPIDFVLGEDQFFVMGDNSPQSMDARLWNQMQPDPNGGMAHKPGGNYLERRLLVGRAISVVWPHTWNFVIPGFTDMRRIQ